MHKLPTEPGGLRIHTSQRAGNVDSDTLLSGPACTGDPLKPDLLIPLHLLNPAISRATIVETNTFWHGRPVHGDSMAKALGLPLRGVKSNASDSTVDTCKERKYHSGRNEFRHRCRREHRLHAVAAVCRYTLTLIYSYAHACDLLGGGGAAIHFNEYLNPALSKQ